MRTTLYVSGPMTGIKDHNFPAFRAAAAELKLAGYRVEDPSVKGVVPGWTWEQYLKHDLIQMLRDCTGVAVLPGWRESRGAMLETYVANALGMPIRTVDQWVDAVGYGQVAA